MGSKLVSLDVAGRREDIGVNPCIVITRAATYLCASSPVSVGRSGSEEISFGHKIH